MNTVRVSRRNLFNIVKNDYNNINGENTENIVEFLIRDFDIDGNNSTVVNQIKRNVQTGFLCQFNAKVKVIKKRKPQFDNFESLNPGWLYENIDISYNIEVE